MSLLLFGLLITMCLVSRAIGGSQSPCDNSIWTPIIANPSPNPGNNFIPCLSYPTSHKLTAAIPKYGPDGDINAGALFMCSDFEFRNSVARYLPGDTKLKNSLFIDAPHDMDRKNNSVMTRITTSYADNLFMIYSEYNATTDITTIKTSGQWGYTYYFSSWNITTVWSTPGHVAKLDCIVFEDNVYIFFQNGNKEVIPLVTSDMVSFTVRPPIQIYSVGGYVYPDSYKMLAVPDPATGGESMYMYWNVANKWVHPADNSWQSVLCNVHFELGKMILTPCKVLNGIQGNSVNLWYPGSVNAAVNHDGTKLFLTRSGYMQPPENRTSEDVPTVVWQVLWLNETGDWRRTPSPICSESRLIWTDVWGYDGYATSYKAPAIVSNPIYNVLPGVPLALGWSEASVEGCSSTCNWGLYTQKGDPYSLT